MNAVTGEEMTKFFHDPPEGYGIVPFYWWLGDPVTKEKLLYHLECLEGCHISGLQINYAHSDQGGQSFGLTYPGEPAVFSEEWWELTGWFIQEAKKRGIAVSLSDYTLGTPGQGYYADWILQKYPWMQGCMLGCFRHSFQKDEKICLGADAIVWPDGKESMPMDWKLLSMQVRGKNGEVNGIPEWRTGNGSDLLMKEEGELILIYSWRKPFSLDPMYPGIGEKYIENFFGRFEEHFPGECGKGLNFFFSDELNFNVGGNLWNESFAEEFLTRKGYDLIPKLYLIFEAGNPEAVPVRLDYYDVIVQLSEENYFSKIYQWHQDRGMIYGCDHGGRGKDLVEFGDYMRTQKYNQGPGCDQPGLQSDIIKNKVASSISHLYRRPRVWLEGFYGSGWGTSTQQLADAVARNYVMGHNLLSLHGFYYSTHGGFWEWAPPCNCVRTPYWKDMRRLNAAVERMSWLMSRGAHCCRIGILYPVAAVEGGIEAKEAVDTAFSLGEALYKQGYDFDFLDFESVQSAGIGPGGLEIGEESYSLVVLPHMRSVREKMYSRLAEVCGEATVLVTGCFPSYSDGRIDRADSCLREKAVFAADVQQAMEIIREKVEKDVIPEKTESYYVCHRKTGKLDIYMTYGIEEGEACFLRGQGNAYYLDAWEGRALRLKSRETVGGVWVEMPVSSGEFQVIALGELPEAESFAGRSRAGYEKKLSDTWKFHLIPTLDNRWGDFDLPPSEGVLPCQVKHLHEGEREWKIDSAPFFLYKEEFSDRKSFFHELEKASQGELDGYKEYVFSLRYGVEEDPGHQGYHGLKGMVTDDFLRIGEPCIRQTEVEMMPYSGGEGKIFAANVYSDMAREALILAGELKPERLYVNGAEVTGKGSVPLRPGGNLVVAGYLQPGRTHLAFVQKEYEEVPFPLAMKWYRMKGFLPWMPAKTAGEEEFWFTSPPGLEKIRFHIRGAVKEAWAESPEDGIRNAQIRQNGSCVEILFHEPIPTCAKTILRVCPAPGYGNGAVFDGPLDLACGEGRMQEGDWSRIDAMRYYSGGASYSQEFDWTPEEGARVWLEMEKVVSTAEIYVNGRPAGIRVTAPWRQEIGSLLRAGKNEIEVRVFSTLGNHYEFLPTRYKSGTEAGLMGRTRLWVEKQEGDRRSRRPGGLPGERQN